MADWGRSVALMWWVAILAAFLTAVGLLGLDQRVTTFSGGPQVGEDFLRNGTSLLDLLTLKNISNFLLGALLLLGAAILLAIRRARRIGWGLLYLASVQFVATVVAALSKPLFGRLRPYEVVSEAGIADTWFVGANAFPSGHTAFYAGLFFPLVLIRPRWTFVLLIPPIFIATARVVQHQHAGGRYARN